MSVKNDAVSKVDWVGHPWVTPALIWLTVEVIALAIALTWVELIAKLAFTSVGSFPFVVVTYGLVALVWFIGAVRLALIRASHKYTLRGSSLEIQRGVLSRKIYTVSAAGFSDLEVLKSITGRILNMGTIVIETDSHRDLKLIKIRDPIKVSTMIRQVMTVPMVRLAPEGHAPAVQNQGRS
ncbi:MAG: PH domain-containing protein [Thaumarchaeota archaeon]|nr:PH domain-containing protein [Nitrososphaerota archaeon]